MFGDRLWNNLKIIILMVSPIRRRGFFFFSFQGEMIEWVEFGTYELWQSLKILSWWIYWSGVILVSCGCHNKLPQAGWLKTIEIYSPTVLEARSPKSRCRQGHIPSEGSVGESFLVSSSFWWLQVFLGLYMHSSSLSACIFTWPSPLYL